MKKFPVKKLVLLAVFAALAYVIVFFVRIPAVAFLKYEPKDVVITIAGFILGPFASVIISALVALLEMVTISETGPIGALMNLLSSCAFACPAAIIYKYRRTLLGAVGGLLAGTVTMVAVMLLWNWLITPLYMGVSREAVTEMLLPAFLPFNLLKAGLNSALVMVLYKPLVTALRKTGLVTTSVGKSGSAKLGIYLFAGGLLVSCILLLLVFRGIL
jgi:riboflavin transporter FmnP